MKLTEEQMLNMRANRDFLAELICATQTPNIPASIRQRAQEILSQYPALPLIEDFNVSAYCVASKLEHAATISRLVKKNQTWRSSVTEFLSNAEKTQNACFYVGLAGSAMAIGTTVCILFAQH